MANIQLTKNLRYKRDELGLTQEELSEILNFSRQAYSNYETGKRNPDLDTLIRLCDFYKITLDELINRNLPNQIAERKAPYRYAIEIESADTLYLSKDEVELLMQYRSMDEDDRRLLRKLYRQPEG